MNALSKALAQGEVPQAVPLYRDAKDFRESMARSIRIDTALTVASLSGEPQEGRPVSYRFEAATLEVVEKLFSEMEVLLCDARVTGRSMKAPTQDPRPTTRRSS